MPRDSQIEPDSPPTEKKKFKRPKSPQKLTANMIANLETPPAAEGLYQVSDAEVRPLRVRVMPSGSKTLNYRLEIDGVRTGSFGPAEDYYGKEKDAQGRETSRTKIEALRERVREMRRRANEGLPLVEPEAPKEMTLAMGWVKAREEMGEDGKSPTTISWYEDAMRNLLKPLQDKTLREIGTDKRGLNEHFDKLKKAISPSRADQAWTVLSAIYNRLEGPQDLPTWSRKAWKRPKLKRREFTITDQLIRDNWAAFQTFRPAKRAFYQLAMFTGMRRTEALSLEWRDIHWKGGWITIRVSKSGVRRVPMTPRIAEILHPQRGAHDTWVFPARHQSGNRIGPRGEPHQQGPGHMINVWDERCKSPHHWRHAFITIARSIPGVQDSTVSTLVGHKGALIGERGDGDRDRAAPMSFRYSQPYEDPLHEAQRMIGERFDTILAGGIFSQTIELPQESDD